MFNPSATVIDTGVKRLKAGYRRVYGTLEPIYVELVGQVATDVLNTIARSDALYHNVEHTLLVALVGQEILRGKHQQESSVSCKDWAEFIISLLCHDIGYVKGVCRQDRAEHRLCTTAGIEGEMVVLAPGATDASLMPFHVDRGKQYIQETFADHPFVDLKAIQRNIELTRFPIPDDELHQEIATYAALARSADLIGQLSDPRYLQKIPALFHELEEVGVAQAMGYRHPGDLRAGYPTFFRTAVYPHIQPALAYLQATRKGRHYVATLYANLRTVEQERDTVVHTVPDAKQFSLQGNRTCSTVSAFLQSLPCSSAPVEAIA